MPDTLPDLKRLGLPELEAYAVAQGHPRYRGKQIFDWLYGKGARSFEEMTNLPKPLRLRLTETARIGTLKRVQLQTATDQTAKALFELETGRHIETVLIPDFHQDGRAKRLTVCVSSQVGCAMGCTFCATGTMGFLQNLTAGEIFDQVRAMDILARERFGRGITNIVYMGMGEPLLNYDNVLKSTRLICHPDTLDLSPKRITVSTVGLAKQIKRLAEDQAPFNLAISLHAPTDPQRSAIMPVNRNEKTDLGALREAVQTYYRTLRRRITYEYCMFRGINDAPEDARNLARITRWAPSKVNLIMYNPVEGFDFERTTDARLHAFIATLVEEGTTVTVRKSRGQDIDAACGQLAVEEA